MTRGVGRATKGGFAVHAAIICSEIIRHDIGAATYRRVDGRAFTPY